MSVNITGRIKVYEKKVILTAVIIGALSELAAVIYTIHIRSNAVIGGEYFILPLFIMAAYCVLEIIGTVESNKKTAVRLTRRTKYGDAVLNHEIISRICRGNSDT